MSATRSNGSHVQTLALASVLLVAMGCGAMTAAQAQGLRYLNNTPVSYFDKTDVDLMTKNAQSVLVSSDRNAKSDWTNPKTGNSGESEVMEAFDSNGTPCKRLRVSNTATRRNVKGEVTYALCNMPGKGWQVQSKSK